jgi:hypothetical protein
LISGLIKMYHHYRIPISYRRFTNHQQPAFAAN